MSVDNIRNVRPSVEILIDLDIDVGVLLPGLFPIIGFWKEAGRSQYETWQTADAVEQLAQVLGSELGDPVDVLGHRHDILRDPSSRRSKRRSQCPAEHASSTRKDEGAHSSCRSFLQQIKRTRDIGIDEVLPSVCDNVWLVQRRRVQNRMHTIHTPLDEAAIRDRPYFVGEVRFLDVNANRLVTRFKQPTHECLTQMSRAARDEDSHTAAIVSR